MPINSPTTTGQVLTSAYVNNLPRGVISYTYNTTATLTVTTLTETELFRAPAFTPLAGRLYRLTYSVGSVAKTTGVGNIDIRIRKDSVSGTILNNSFYSAVPVNVYLPYSTSVVLTSTQMGTASFIPILFIVTNSNGFTAANTSGNNGTIVIEDIGAA
jgi:hypothetical protein